MIIKDNNDLEKNPDFKSERFLFLKQKIKESLVQISSHSEFIPGFYDQLILHSLLYKNHKAIFTMLRRSSKTYGILLMVFWRPKLYLRERIIIFGMVARLREKMVNALKLFISIIDKSYDVKNSHLYIYHMNGRAPPACIYRSTANLFLLQTTILRDFIIEIIHSVYSMIFH